METSPADLAIDFFESLDEFVNVGYGHSFVYNLESNTIVIGLSKFGSYREFDDEIDEIHIFLLKTNGYDFTPYCSYQTFCLIHEMGHASTLANLNDKELVEELTRFKEHQKTIDFGFENDIIDYEQVQELHMAEKLERLANAWAFQFILNNVEQVKAFDKHFLELVDTMVE